MSAIQAEPYEPDLWSAVGKAAREAQQLWKNLFKGSPSYIDESMDSHVGLVVVRTLRLLGRLVETDQQYIDWQINPAKTETETAWLLERLNPRTGNAELWLGTSEVQWLGTSGMGGGWYWQPDPSDPRVIRFARKMDADAVKRTFFLGDDVRSAEHLWAKP